MNDGYPTPGDHEHVLGGVVRFGRITTVDVNGKIAATVTYPDKKFQTAKLPVLQKNTVGTQEYYVPVKGEVVAVLHLPNGPEQGIILGSVYTTTNPPPRNLESMRGVVFGDGSFVIYSTDGGGDYQISLAGKASITAAGNVNITAPNTVIHGAVQITGNVTITGTLTVSSTVTFQAGGTIATHLTNNDGSGGGS